MKKTPRIPSRPRSHTIEDEHRLAFQALVLQAGWVYRRLDSPDYGIDGQVEIFLQGEMCGLAFYVQLRATDEPDPKKARKIRLSSSELKYYLSKTEPVMVVKYASSVKKMYWQWASLIPREGEWTKESKNVFPFLQPREWTDESPQEIQGDVEVERAIAMRMLSQPYDLNLQILSAPDSYSPVTLCAELNGLAAKSGSLCRVSQNAKSRFLRISVYKQLVNVSLGIKSSFTFDSSRGEQLTARGAACDIWCAAGYLMCLVGEQNVGGVLISQAINDSRASECEGFAYCLSSAMVIAGDIDVAGIAISRYANAVADPKKLVRIVRHLPGLGEWRDPACRVKALNICQDLVHIVQRRFGNSSAAAIAFELAIGLPSEFAVDAQKLLDQIEYLDSEFRQRTDYWLQRAIRQLDLDQLTDAAESASLADSLGSSAEVGWVRIHILAAQGLFKQAADLLFYAREPDQPRRSSQLLGILSTHLVEASVSEPLSRVEDTCAYLEQIAHEATTTTQIVAFAAWLMLWALDIGRPDALLNGTLLIGELVGTQTEVILIAELAICVGIEVYGKAFPAMMADYLHALEMPAHFADSLVNAFSQKVIEMETGEGPDELLFPNEDGAFVRLVRREESPSWMFG